MILEGKKLKEGDFVEVNSRFKNFRDRRNGNPIRFEEVNGGNISFFIEQRGTIEEIIDEDHAIVNIYAKDQGIIGLNFHKENLQLPALNAKEIVSAWRKAVD